MSTSNKTPRNKKEIKELMEDYWFSTVQVGEMPEPANYIDIAKMENGLKSSSQNQHPSPDVA